MRLIRSFANHCLRFFARSWLHFWRAVRYWHFLNYSWHLAWHKARRS